MLFVPTLTAALAACAAIGYSGDGMLCRYEITCSLQDCLRHKLLVNGTGRNVNKKTKGSSLICMMHGYTNMHDAWVHWKNLNDETHTVNHHLSSIELVKYVWVYSTYIVVIVSSRNTSCCGAIFSKSRRWEWCVHGESWSRVQCDLSVNWRV